MGAKIPGESALEAQQNVKESTPDNFKEDEGDDDTEMSDGGRSTDKEAMCDEDYTFCNQRQEGSQNASYH